MRLAKSLLWIDCTGGLLVGVVVLALADWLATLYALPVGLVTAIGAANLLYGAFSFSLARRAVRPHALIVVLVAANLAWAVLCALAAARFASEASLLGVGTLLFESLFVGGLAMLEWRHRADLLTAA